MRGPFSFIIVLFKQYWSKTENLSGIWTRIVYLVTYEANMIAAANT